MPGNRPPPPHEAMLRLFVPQRPDEHAVPAPVLARTLGSLQQIAFLLTAVGSAQPAHDRFRVSDELRARGTLLCKPPQDGSFAVGLQPLDNQIKINLGQFDVLTALWGLFAAIGAGASDIVDQMLPDVGMRLRALHEVRKLAPQPGDRWLLGFATHNQRDEAVLDARVHDTIGTWLDQLEPEGEVTTVTGRMLRVDFAKSLFTLRYPPTKKSIPCFYRTDLEDDILAMRRTLIQVTGKFILDNQGHPIKITDVFKIAPIDKSPMSFNSTQYGNRIFSFTPDVAIDVSMDDSCQLYTAAYEPFGIYVYAPTRLELVQEFAAQTAMAWDEYAMCSPDLLSGDALSIKNSMLRQVKVKEHA